MSRGAALKQDFYAVPLTQDGGWWSGGWVVMFTSVGNLVAASSPLHESASHMSLLRACRRLSSTLLSGAIPLDTLLQRASLSEHVYEAKV